MVRPMVRRSSTSAPLTTANAPQETSWSWKPVSWSSPLQQMSQTSTRLVGPQELEDPRLGVVAHARDPEPGGPGQPLDEGAQVVRGEGARGGREQGIERSDHASTSWGAKSRAAPASSRTSPGPPRGSAGRRRPPGGRSRRPGVRARPPRPPRRSRAARTTTCRRRAAGRRAPQATPARGQALGVQRREARQHGEAGAQAGMRRAHPGAERHPGGVDLRDVRGQRRPPVGRAPPRGGGGAPRGRAGVHEERRPALLERGEQGRAASRALGAAQGAGRQAEADEALVQAIGRARRGSGRRQARARPGRAAGRPGRRRPRGRRRAAPRPRPGGRASMPRGLDSATIARSRPSRSTSSARRTGSWSAGSTGHSGSPAMRSTHPSPARRMSGGRERRRERRQEGLGPEVLVHVDAPGHRAVRADVSGRAGTPPMRTPGATSSITTAPAPTTAPSPIVRPWRTTAPAADVRARPDDRGAAHPRAGGDVGSTRPPPRRGPRWRRRSPGRRGRSGPRRRRSRRPSPGRPPRAPPTRRRSPRGGRSAGRRKPASRSMAAAARRGRRRRRRRSPRSPSSTPWARRAAMASPPTTGQPSTVPPCREGSASSRATTRYRKTDRWPRWRTWRARPRRAPAIGGQRAAPRRARAGERCGAARPRADGVVRSRSLRRTGAERLVTARGRGERGAAGRRRPVHQFSLSHR